MTLCRVLRRSGETDEVIYGGYTARVALNDMPKEEADKYRPMFRD